MLEFLLFLLAHLENPQAEHIFVLGDGFGQYDVNFEISHMSNIFETYTEYLPNEIAWFRMDGDDTNYHPRYGMISMMQDGMRHIGDLRWIDQP